MGEWDVVKENINRSKIRRFPYKQLLGKSLTNYILECKANGLTKYQIMAKIQQEPGIKRYLEENRFDVYKLKENIWIGINARLAEENMRGR